MRWPWSRKSEAAQEVSPTLDDALTAKQEAQAELKKVRKNRSEIDNIVSSIRELREGDPLASLFLDSLKSDRKPHRERRTDS